MGRPVNKLQPLVKKYRSDYLALSPDYYEKGGYPMSDESKKAKEERRKEVSIAERDAKNFKAYFKLFLSEKSKRYTILFLQRVIFDLRQIYDKYYPLGKEDEKND